MSSSPHSLSDCAAISVIDDALTSIFIDAPLEITTKKASDERWSLEINLQSLEASHRQIAHGRKLSERRRREHLARISTHVLAQGFGRQSSQSGQQIWQYLWKCALPRTCSLAGPIPPPLRRRLPPGFSPHHIYLLVKQLENYLIATAPGSKFAFCRTMAYGSRPEAAVLASCTFDKHILLPDLIGILVELDVQSMTALKTFSIVTSLARANGPGYIFLGPARFVNHSCDPNIKLERINSLTVGFRSIRRIRAGEELFAFYGEHYFGPNNCECLCQACQERSRAAPSSRT